MDEECAPFSHFLRSERIRMGGGEGSRFCRSGCLPVRQDLPTPMMSLISGISVAGNSAGRFAVRYFWRQATSSSAAAKTRPHGGLTRGRPTGTLGPIASRSARLAGLPIGGKVGVPSGRGDSMDREFMKTRS